MGRGKSVTPNERGQIQAFHEMGYSTRQIAIKIGRSQTLVEDCIKRGVEKDPGKSSGRKRKLSVRDDRNISRHASNNRVSAYQIIQDLNLDVSKDTVLRSLDRAEHLQYKHFKRRPNISHQNVAERLAFAKAHVAWEDHWHKVIFSDEKAFNLDGPDGWSYYWHDLRKEEVLFSKRKYGGGTVKIWIGFSYDYKADLGLIDGTLNSKSYIKLLSTRLQPLYEGMEDETDQTVYFQQDNDSAHVSNATMDWLEQQGILLLGWPANSPDLAPAENILGVLARAVYKNNSHYNNAHDLRNAIVKCWDELSQDSIKHTIDSMKDRMIDAIAAHGHSTSY